MIFRYCKKIVLLCIFFVLTSSIYSQVYKYKNLHIDCSEATKITLSGNSYAFMALRQHLGVLNIIIKETKDENVINSQKNLVDNLIRSSQMSKSIVNNTYAMKDEFKGWIVLRANNINKNTINKEIPLFESYSFFYIAEFLYLLKQSGWVNQSHENKEWWEKTVDFVEQNIWTKWRTRSYKSYKLYNRYFLRSRTHMGSHWAGIASFLHEITENNDIKEQTAVLIQQYDKLLKRNLRVKKGAYVWNSTYDDTNGTDAIKSDTNIIQDRSHGNHVISYVIAAYELGNNNWTKKDLKYFSNTVTKLMYNKKTNSFADNVEGIIINREFARWSNPLSSEWARLGRYDNKVTKILGQDSYMKSDSK